MRIAPVLLVVLAGCSARRVEPARAVGSEVDAAIAPPTATASAIPTSVAPTIAIATATATASASASASASSPPDTPSPLSTLFDGDPEAGPIKLRDTRCGPGCLQYPAGWLATDDGGMVYTWFFKGEGQFGTAEVMRCPLDKLDDKALALRLRFAGGDRVAWSAPVDGAIGKEHLRATIAEGRGTSHGRKAHFFYAHVDVGKRKDLVIAWVVDGEQQARKDEMIAVVRSVRSADGRAPPR